MAIPLLLAIFSLLGGALLAHRWLRETDPWLLAGLTPLMGAGLLALLIRLRYPPLELYLLMLAGAVLLTLPGPVWRWGPPWQALLVVGGAAATTLMMLSAQGDAGWSGLAVADAIRFPATSPAGFETLVARFTPSFRDPLASAWGVQLALQVGGSLLLWGLIARRCPGPAGWLAAFLAPLGPARLGPCLGPLWLYLLLRLTEPGLSLAVACGGALSLAGVAHLARPEWWPWWCAGWLVAGLRLRRGKDWLIFGLAWLAALPAPTVPLQPRLELSLALVPVLLLAALRSPALRCELLALTLAGLVACLLGGDPWELRVAAGAVAGQRLGQVPGLLLAALALVARTPPALPVLPTHWRALHQQVSLSCQHALAWIAPQTLPGERIVCDQPGPAALAPVLCALQPAPKDNVWKAFRACGRGDLLWAAGVHWVLADPGGLPDGVEKNVWLTPGPTFHRCQPFQVRSLGGPYLSDYAFPAQVSLPPGPLQRGRWYPVHIEITNHDRRPRQLGWLRCQVQDEAGQDLGPPLELLPGRGRLGPGAGDVIEHSLVTPDRPGRYRLQVSQPYTDQGAPFLLQTLTFEVN